jgi:predicted DNA-binding transcriptional regulator YafY
VVHPLALVVKDQVWYLIAQTEAGQRTFRVSRVQSVARTDRPAQRPVGFDLSAAWRDIVTTLDRQRAPVSVHLRTDADTVDLLRSIFGTRMVEGFTSSDGRVDVEARGRSEEVVARQLAGLAGRIEVLSPARVRHHLADIGRTLVQSYGASSAGGDG